MKYHYKLSMLIVSVLIGWTQLASASHKCSSAFKRISESSILIRTVSGKDISVNNQTDYLVEEALYILREVVMKAIVLHGQKDASGWSIKDADGNYTLVDVDDAAISNLLSSPVSLSAMLNLRKSPDESWNPVAIEAVRTALSDKHLAIASSFAGSRQMIRSLIEGKEDSVWMYRLRALIKFCITKDSLEYLATISNLK